MLLACSLSARSNGRTVSLESLLREMTDRNSLPQYPDPFYTCKQFSSYDQATVAPGDVTYSPKQSDRNRALLASVQKQL